MKLPGTIILAAGCIVIALASCKKEANTSPVRNYLIGKWTPTTEATDANGNGIMDANEVVAAYTYKSHQLAFNSDGTLSILTSSGQLAGEKTWELTNSDSYLKTGDKGTGANAASDHIDNITSSAITLKDTIGGIAKWYLFTKQ